MSLVKGLFACIFLFYVEQSLADESESSTQVPSNSAPEEDEGNRLFEEDQWTPTQPNDPNLEKNLPPSPAYETPVDSESAEVQGTEAKKNQELMNREEGDMNEIPDSLRRPRRWRAGPTISLSIPYLLTTSIDAWLVKAFSLGIGYGQTEVSRNFGKSIDQMKVQVQEWDFRVRYHPFLGDFFVGIASGVMNLKFEAQKKASTTANGQTINGVVASTSEIRSKFINPHIGWITREDSGFTIGFELGLNIPIKSSSSFKSEALDSALDSELKEDDEFKEQKKDLEDLVGKVEKTVIPYINFLRIGWLF